MQTHEHRNHHMPAKRKAAESTASHKPARHTLDAEDVAEALAGQHISLSETAVQEDGTLVGLISAEGVEKIAALLSGAGKVK